MRTVSKDDAIKMLESIVSDIEQLPAQHYSNLVAIAPWDAWSRSAMIRVRHVFGTGSSQIEEIEGKLKKVQSKPCADDKKRVSVEITALIKSMVLEVSELWEDESLESRTLTSDEERESADHVEPLNSDHVFVVHGHDHGSLQTVARFVERLGLAVTILHERPSEGATIIEKLEVHGNASFAVVLLTPDDVGAVATQADKLKPRARQNVVLELGYFLGRLGRRGVAALVSHGVELPSDYSGVVYIDLDEPGAWKFHLAKELRAAGLPVNADALL